MFKSSNTKSRSTKTRNLVLAAAALVTLGTAALSSTEASAFGYRHGGFHHYHFGHYGHRWNHWSHYRYHWHYRWNYRRFSYSHYSYRWPHTYYRGPAFGASAQGPVQSAGPASAPAQMMAPARPACLAKQYTPEGAVVFVDRCTQESAISPPAGAPPAGGQAPQQ